MVNHGRKERSRPAASEMKGDRDMASVSSTSSLGNTSLRGFGGMASGIDRDSIIEKMTLGTTTKINNQKKKVTELQWKQEAYRGISDKIIDWSDTYASYASDKNLKDPTVFSKNQITAHGKEDSTSRVSVTGSSSMIDNISIKGVVQTATSTVRQSKSHSNKDGIVTTLADLNAKNFKSPNLKDQKIWFAGPANTEGKRNMISFTFGSSYTGDDGKSVDIDYTKMDVSTKEGRDKILAAFNGLLADSNISFGENQDIEDVLEFDFKEVTGEGDSKQYQLQLVSKGEGLGSYTIDTGYSKKALAAMGYESKEGTGQYIDIATFNEGVKKDFKEASIVEQNGIEVLTGKSVTFNYNGISKSIQLITDDEVEKLNEAADAEAQLKLMAKNIQKRLDQAFGKGAVTAEVIEEGENKGKLAFNTQKGTVSVTAGDLGVLTNMGLEYGASNKVNLNDSLKQDALGLGTDLSDYKVKESTNVSRNGQLDLKINGVDITGLTENSSISDILRRINATKEAGVKATYVDSTGKFTLISSETGEGREISLDSKLAKALFGRDLEFKGDSNHDELSDYADGDGKINFEIKGAGATESIKVEGLDKNSTAEEIMTAVEAALGEKGLKLEAASNGQMKIVDSEGKTYALDESATSGFAKALLDGDIKVNGNLSEGQNAKVLVSYGNGVDVMLDRSSNTFNLEGLTVTVSGEFGDVKGSEEEGWTSDTSEAVTFSAKADVDGALEKVKKFIEDYNALVTEINNQITTRPDSSYGALTDEQKEEMDDTSIENWEKKAKQGILYGDSIMRDLSMDVQSVFTKMMSNGATYEDLQAVGISYAEDWGDGGTLVFDEAKFKAAMETDPDKVSNIFTGGGNVKKGLIDTIDETFTPYATRYASKNRASGGKGSYGRLIEVAGSEKKPSTIMDNEIYKQLKEMQETIDKLQDQLKVEQDRYISQFTTMETLLNQMNTQSSYLSQLTA